MRFWLKNKDDFKKDEMVRAFKQIASDDSIRMESYVGDRVTLTNMTYKIYAKINYHRSANIFKKFWLDKEEVKEKEKK